MTLEEFERLAGPYDGVVIDIGTGDGRFVSSMAKTQPGRFFIGVDANAKPLEKLSMKATRKPAKGGLSNAIFVQAAVEDLPEEFFGIATGLYVHFPWGSLLRAVAVGDELVLASLRRIVRENAVLEVTLGVDPVRDQTELERLGLPELTRAYFDSELVPKYKAAGFALLESRELKPHDWARIETSWARKLGGRISRRVFRLRFRAT